MLSNVDGVSSVSMTAPNLSQLLFSDKEDFNGSSGIPNQHSASSSPSQQFSTKLNQVCGLLLQLTEEQRETNLLLRKLINDDNPGHYKLVQLANQEKYIRFLVVLENDRSRPRLNCPICLDDVEITTAKRGGCKQQSFCGDYVVCNECTNDALQKIMRCPQCCETYSNIPVPLCPHLEAITNSGGHLARKGSGNGCPVCNSKLVKDKCSHNCSRKNLANYNRAKTVLSERVFVLVKNPEACTEDEDRPCSHYCRCTKHNILFTNRNKGAKCRECTKETTKQKQLGKRKRKSQTQTPSPSGSIPQHAKRFCPPISSPYVDMPQSNAQQIHQQQQLHLQRQQQQHQQHQQHLQHLQQQQRMQQMQQMAPEGYYSNLGLSQENIDSFGDVPSNSWLPNFNVRELGKKVNLDDLFKIPIPYSEGVVQFGKRVTNNLSNTLGLSFPDDPQSNTNSNSTQNPGGNPSPR